MVILNPTTVSSVQLTAIRSGLNAYTGKEYYVNRFKICDVVKFRKAVYDR
jgi:hypothetical protein